MNKYRRFAILPVAMLVLAACQGNDEGGSPAASSSGGAAAGNFCAGVSGDDLLATICDEGTIQISTDPNYAPQSFLNDQRGVRGLRHRRRQ